MRDTMPDSHFKENRRSHRILVSMPIRVGGKDLEGFPIQEFSRTLEVSRHGGKFGLKANVGPNLKINILNVHTRVEAPFRVVGKVSSPDPDVIYWIAEQLDPSVLFWGIYFPPMEEEQEAAGRTLLECGRCKRQELSYLSDLEAEVFNYTQRVHHQCEACGDWTEWLNPEPGTEGRVPVAVPEPLEKQRRLHRRLSLQMQVCLRTREGEEEVLATSDISTGGLAVQSTKKYAKGTLLKVAFPFERGGTNIFILSKVVRVSPTEKPSITLYGIQYLR